MSDLNDLNKPVTTDTEPNVLDTLRGHITRAITWTGYTSTANKVAGLMSAVTAAVTGGRSLRLYRRNDGNTADEEVVSLPGVSVGGNAGTASAAQSGSTLETALAAKAPLASPAFTGTPTVPTAALGTNSTQIANMAAVAAAVANIVNTAPAALDTLNELAGALGNDPNFATSMNTALANRVVKTSANRPGVTKLYRNDDDSAYNVQVTWQADRTGYWSLRGYSADTYHAACFVAYSGYADSAGGAPWSGVSGRPTNVSSFSNDSGYINSDGRAYPRKVGGGNLNFSWDGQGGQPTWLWGGSDGVNMYVYNPSNFSVNYANSAGSAYNVPTSAVLSAMSGAGTGSVGTYAFMFNNTSSAIQPGATAAGSTLLYSSAWGATNSGLAAAGTWVCMGYAHSFNSPDRATLFLRIS